MSVYIHPVLRQDTDDINGTGELQVKTSDKGNIVITPVINNSEVEALVSSGKASVQLVLENKKCFYRTHFVTSLEDYTLKMDPIKSPGGIYTVMGYILMFARGLPWLDKEMRAGRWVKHSGMSLRECTLGVVGMGDVGQAVVKRASAFGMTLLGTDIVDVDRPFLDGQGLQMVNLDDLIVESDYISLNCTLNPTSFHLIGLDELLRMKDTCYVINTCRGPVIQESALVTALQKGIIAGAALDVFEHEPLAEDSPLRKLENCFLAPHNANSSPKAWRLVHENTIKNLLLGLEKGNRD